MMPARFILARYLSRQVLVTGMAVALVLTAILLSGRLIRYMGMAASGALSPELLVASIVYRMPAFLELILPLSLFLGILLAYGRLYVESEMPVLFASGVGPGRLLSYTLVPAVLFALLVGLFSLWLTPAGTRQSELMFAQEDSKNTFETLTPGRFVPTQKQAKVTYTEQLSSDRTELRNVFMSEQQPADDHHHARLVHIYAESARRFVEPLNSTQFLLLHNGYRYEGLPGELDYRVFHFVNYMVKLPPSASVAEAGSHRTRSTRALLQQPASPAVIAEQQWRLSLPLSAFIVMLLAVPLAKVNPRQGRFWKLLPGMMLYLVYVALLAGLRSSLEKGKMSSAMPGLWGVHLLFLMVALGLWWLPSAWQRWRYRLAMAREAV